MKVYELKLILQHNTKAKNEKQAKQEMMAWIQRELKENIFSWRIQLINVIEV